MPMSKKPSTTFSTRRLHKYGAPYILHRKIYTAHVNLVKVQVASAYMCVGEKVKVQVASAYM